MGKEIMNSHQFETLLARIIQETHLTENKIEILYASQGFFSAQQAACILNAFGNSADKLRAIQIMEPRLAQMTGSEARDVIGAFSIHADKVKALEYIKSYISDYGSQDGYEYILSAFPFEADKMRASSILNTVNSHVADIIPAGGHQGYAALGGLYTQCRPLVPHLYGNVISQRNSMPGHSTVSLPVGAEPGAALPQYSSHPSYAPPQDQDYTNDRGYPGNPVFNDNSSATRRECTGRPQLPTNYTPGARQQTGY